MKGTFKLYPKLKAFYDVRKEADKANTFDYGFVLKAFPDEPIKVCELYLIFFSLCSPLDQRLP